MSADILNQLFINASKIPHGGGVAEHMAHGAGDQRLRPLLSSCPLSSVRLTSPSFYLGRGGVC